MKKDTCSSILILGLDYVAGNLDAQSVHRVKRHLKKCSECKREFQLLELTDHIGSASAKGAVPPLELIEAIQTDFSGVKIPIRTIKDVLGELRNIYDSKTISPETKNKEAIKMVIGFLMESDEFLRGKPAFDSGKDRMDYEKRKAELLKKIFNDRIARNFLPAIELQAQAFIDQGIIFQIQKQFTEAGNMLGQALAISLSIGDKLQGSVVQRMLGEMEFYQKNYSKAKVLFENALDVVRERSMSEEECVLLRNIGNVEFVQGNTDASLQYLSKAFEISSQLENSTPVIWDLNNLAALKFKMGQIEQAIKYAQHALDHAMKKPDVYLRGQIHGNLGTFYSVTGDLGVARKHWQKAVKLFRKAKVPEDIIWLHKNLAITHYKQRNYLSAHQDLDTALSEASQDEIGNIHILLLRGRIRRLMSNEIGALQDHYNALKSASALKDNLLIRISQREKAFDLYESGNPEQAWLLLEESRMIHRMPSEPDSIFKLEDIIQMGKIAIETGHREKGRQFFSRAKRLSQKLKKWHLRHQRDSLTDEYQYIDELNCVLDRNI